MSKKRRKRKHKSDQPIRQSVRGRQHASAGFSYQQMPSIFQDMSDDEVSEYFKTVGENAERQFKTSLQELEKRLLTVHPLSLLALFAYYGLTVFGGKDPELTQEDPILQHHVELVQAFILQHQPSEFESNPVLPPDFEVFRRLIQEISGTFSFRRFTAFDAAAPREQRRRLSVQESMRIDTQAIRNWGYPQQIMRITTELFSPLDEALEQLTGVRVAHLVKMLSKVGDAIEERISSHFKLLRPMMQAKTIEAAVKEYYLAFPDMQSESAELLQFFEQHDVTLEQAKSMLMSHSDLRLNDIFTLRLDDFVNAYPVPIEPETLRPILGGWTLSFGDLANDNPEYFFMGNPVWGRPFIHLGDDLFFWPIPSIFLSFCIELMEKVINTYPELHARYENRRAKFLEDEIERLFASAMPYAETYRGSQWHDPVTNKDFENDLLILIDTHLIVVEAKSGKVSAPARRGAEQRLQRVINELVIEPSLQANRFANYLQEHPGIHQFSTRSGAINRVDTSEVREVVRLNITLEPVGLLHSVATSIQDQLITLLGRNFLIR